jgi:diguanylate cyclase (GGDEF)-like protein/PAS domain S-box-containing protein
MNDESRTKKELLKEIAALRKRIAQLEAKEARRRKTEEALQESENKYRSLVESTDDSIYLVDKHYKYLYMNKKHLKRMGLTEEKSMGQPYSEFHTPEETGFFMEKIDKVLESGESNQYEYKSLRDGRYFFQTFSPVKEPNGRAVAVTVVSKDVTKLKHLEEELRMLSLTDELTGLYNRRGFQTLAEMQFNISNRLKKGMYLLYADLDGLKEINDNHGHQEGDQALIETAEILKKNYRRSDIIARIGGDEFVVVPVGTSRDSVELITTRLKEAIDEYNTKSSLKYKLSLSVGIAYYDPKNPCTVDELLESADKFMYEHKKQKKDS